MAHTHTHTHTHTTHTHDTQRAPLHSQASHRRQTLFPTFQTVLLFYFTSTISMSPTGKEKFTRWAAKPNEMFMPHEVWSCQWVDSSPLHCSYHPKARCNIHFSIMNTGDHSRLANNVRASTSCWMWTVIWLTNPGVHAIRDIWYHVFIR